MFIRLATGSNSQVATATALMQLTELSLLTPEVFSFFVISCNNPIDIVTIPKPLFLLDGNTTDNNKTIIESKIHSSLS